MEREYDLVYDATEIGGDLVVECWISQGPRAADATFDPQPGDLVTIGDDELPARSARVVRRDNNRVWVQINLTGRHSAVA